MLRKDQAAQLLRQGLPPSQIARQMGTSTSAILQYLALKIGEGDLRRSDLAFSLPPAVRSAIEAAMEKNAGITASRITRELQMEGFATDRNDVAIYLQYRRARVVMGDMYELLRSVELRLHTFVKQAFVLEFGEEQWWRSGVPDNIRAECAALLEKDPEPAAEPYCYTHVISLREILDKRWAVLNKYMPGHLLNKKKELLERLLRLNRIRNGVMHPVRNTLLTEEEFEFVRDLERDLADLQAHLREEAGVTVPDGVPEPEEIHEPPPELVTKLAAVSQDEPAPEQAATPEQAHLTSDQEPELV
ncbi:MAG: hypothetical protein H0X25_06235 [Acidobacteriales bacterium]|nr:hypothetical protein [Terriglobales bacterium]